MSHDEVIREAETTARTARERLEVIRPEFVAAASQWLSAWWENYVATIVRSEHAHTTELGRDELASLKADLRKHMDSAEPTVEQVLVEEDAWPPSPSYSRRLAEPMDKAIRRALGQIAPVVEARGYDDESFERAGAGWRYRFAFDVSDEMLDIAGRGARMAEEVRAAEARVQEAQEAKAQEAADDLWGSV